MKPSVALDAHRAEIRVIVEVNRAVNARVFGSVLRGEDTEDSDLDILVDPEPGMTLLNIAWRVRRRADSECTSRKIS
jgi:predicted nucleotidyltransferase